jgi:hypothetical protein
VSVDFAEGAVLCCTSIIIALGDELMIRSIIEETVVEETKANRAWNVEQRWGWQRKLRWQ